MANMATNSGARRPGSCNPKLTAPPPQACFHCLHETAPLQVCCSGGGIFFFWQLGVLRWLQRSGRLDDAHFVGYSAGALSATMSACGIDPKHAVEAAYALTVKYDIWERPLGLIGVWSGMVREWLEELLPVDAAERCRGRLHVVATHLPSLEPHVFGGHFHDRTSLIEALLASVHVPWMLDGCMSTSLSSSTLACRMSRCHMDGHMEDSGAPSRYVDGHIGMALLGGDAAPPCLSWAPEQTLVIDHLKDDQLGMSMWKFLSLFDYKTVMSLVDAGEAYAQRVWGDGCRSCRGMAKKAEKSKHVACCKSGWSHAAELVVAAP